MQENTGNKVLLSGGDDNDYLGNSGANATLHGDNGNDTIFNHGGNSTIGGYAGNDYINNSGASVTVNGGAGNDTFIYKPGEGKDYIMDYKSGDMLKILNGTFSKSKYSKGTLALTVGSGSVTFKNVTTSTTFNINGNAYHISGKKLVK